MSSTATLHMGEVRAGRFDSEVFVNCLQNSQKRVISGTAHKGKGKKEKISHKPGIEPETYALLQSFSR